MKRLVVGALLVLSAQSVSAAMFSQLDESEEFKDYYYLGVGLGYSFIHPERGGVTLYHVADDNDLGFRLQGGYRWRPRWSVEFSYLDMGEAAIESTIPNQNLSGGISYEAMGIHGNYHFAQELINFDAFLKLGVATLSTDKTNPLIPMEKQKGFHLMTGLGGTKNIKNDWDLRFDADFFSRDAAMLSLGIQKKFLPKDKPVPPPVPVDTDQDTVLDPDDLCPGTELGLEVDEDGCALPLVEEVVEEAFAAIDFKGINFKVSSAELTPSSLSVLDEAALVLVENPSVKLEIEAHSDSDGSAKFNQKLSQRRAESVRVYLVSKGVLEENMKAIGYGEERPIADNSSAEGKAKNRRVEFIVIMPERAIPEEVVAPEDDILEDSEAGAADTNMQSQDVDSESSESIPANESPANNEDS